MFAKSDRGLLKKAKNCTPGPSYYY